MCHFCRKSVLLPSPDINENILSKLDQIISLLQSDNFKETNRQEAICTKLEKILSYMKDSAMHKNNKQCTSSNAEDPDQNLRSIYSMKQLKSSCLEQLNFADELGMIWCKSCERFKKLSGISSVVCMIYLNRQMILNPMHVISHGPSFYQNYSS